MNENDILPMGESPIPIAQANGTLVGPTMSNSGGGIEGLLGMAGGMINLRVSPSIPPYWSMRRELYLNDISYVLPEVKIAINNSVRHLTSIVPDVMPRDPDNRTDVFSAHLQDFILKKYWGEIAKMVRDFIVHDIGGFVEILSFHDPEDEDIVERDDGTTLVGPLKPYQIPGTNGVWLSAAGFRALDPLRCIPTRDPEYPVIYKDTTNKRYALHHTRVLRMVNLPSSKERMNNVGLSYLSIAIEEANQLFNAERIQTATLEGKPLKSIMLVAPWNGADFKRSVSELYEFQAGINDRPGQEYTLPIATVGVPPELHTINGAVITNFEAKVMELERLPEGYDRDAWSESLLRKMAAIVGLPLKSFGLDQRFSSRMDSESQSDLMHNVGASQFIRFVQGDVEGSFCTLATCLDITYNDEILEARQMESRRMRAETNEINLSSGAGDLESVLNDRLAHGEITEADRERILSNASQVSQDVEQKAPPSFGNFEPTDYNKLAGFDGEFEPLEVPDEPDEKNLDSYSRGLRAIVRGVWRGEFDRDEAIEDMVILVAQNMRDSARRAARPYGVVPSEFTDRENELINSMIEVHSDSIDSIIGQAADGSRDNGGKLGPLLARLELWYPRYEELAESISASVAKDLKLIWQVDPAKENCNDCLKLNGRIARGSTWHDRGILPKSRILECGGWRCGCGLNPTTQPATRGRWPNIG